MHVSQSPPPQIWYISYCTWCVCIQTSRIPTRKVGVWYRTTLLIWLLIRVSEFLHLV